MARVPLKPVRSRRQDLPRRSSRAARRFGRRRRGVGRVPAKAGETRCAVRGHLVLGSGPWRDPRERPLRSADGCGHAAGTRDIRETLRDNGAFDGIGLPRVQRVSSTPARRLSAANRSVPARTAAGPAVPRPSAPNVLPPAASRRGRARCSRRRALPFSGSTGHLRILMTRPEPTVWPPSRMAKPRPSSMAIGWMSSTVISVLSPGMTISVPSGRVMIPVTSVVRK